MILSMPLRFLGNSQKTVWLEVQLRTIAMDMWASLEHELRYKSTRAFSQADANRLRLCSEAVFEVDREMQNIYKGKPAEYEEGEPESASEQQSEQ